MIPKFRAWDKANQKETDYAIYPNHLIFYNANDGKWIADDERFILMQSTGLKDKNGVEIYEGDIAKNISAGSIGIVVWDIYRVGFMRKVKCKKMNLFNYFTLYGSQNNMEVIGNIYENPELMEV